MEPLDELLSQIDELPTLPEIPTRIARELEDPECSMRKIAELVALDPMLSARVIQLANSPVFAPAREIDSVQSAIVRLGIQETRSLIVTAAVMDAIPQRSRSFDVRGFWTLGLASALASKSIAEDLKYERPSYAYLAGLVHGIGEAILGIYFPDRFERAVADARANRCGLVVAVWSEFRFTHPVLCARVLERWRFAGPIVEAVEYHLDPYEAPEHALLSGIVFAGDRVCRGLGFGPPDPGQEEKDWVSEIPTDLVERILESGYDDLDVYLETQREQLREVGGLVRVVFQAG